MNAHFNQIKSRDHHRSLFKSFKVPSNHHGQLPSHLIRPMSRFILAAYLFVAKCADKVAWDHADRSLSIEKPFLEGTVPS